MNGGGGIYTVVAKTGVCAVILFDGIVGFIGIDAGRDRMLGREDVAVDEIVVAAIDFRRHRQSTTTIAASNDSTTVDHH